MHAKCESDAAGRNPPDTACKTFTLGVDLRKASSRLHRLSQTIYDPRRAAPQNSDGGRTYGKVRLVGVRAEKGGRSRPERHINGSRAMA